MRIAIYTLGCKVNQFESFAICDKYHELGCTIVDWKEDADIYVVNTCAVTSKAAYQSRQILRRIRRQHPNAKIIATGCHVQTDPGLIISSVGSGICLAGNEQKSQIAPMSLKYKGDSCTGIFVSDISKVKKISPLFLNRPPKGRTRVFLKIQDGCNAFCSYCIVPYARGRSRSLPKEEVISQVATLAKQSVKEICLTGIHIGYYGRDLSPRCDLFSLIKELCETFPSVRFRLSSIEPTELDLDFVRYVKTCHNFCRHFHIPLQSGSDKVLSDMNRTYKASMFKELILEIKEILPECSIGTDVMTGFPTETENDFEKSYELLNSLPISYLHAFPYSPRPGTVSFYMKRLVNQKEAKRRAQKLIELGLQKKKEFYKCFLNKEVLVLFERRLRKNKNFYEGHSDNYLLVRSMFETDLSNSLRKVKIISLYDDKDVSLLAKVID